MLRHFLCVPYVRLHAETIVPARRPRFRRTNLLPRCLSKGFHADATNCKLVTPLGIHLLSARQRYYNLRTCSGQSEEVFPYLTPFTALGCAYERAPPGFPVQASRPRSASHPIGVDSLPIRILQGLLLHACTPIGRHGAKLTLINVKICRPVFRHKENKVPERNPSQKNCPLSHATRSVRKVSNITKATLTEFYSIKVASHGAGNSPAYFYSLNQAIPYITKTFQTCCPERTR